MEARRNRSTEMCDWEGIVDGFVTFPLKESGELKVEERVVVDWGIRREGGQAFVWTERAENLRLA